MMATARALLKLERLRREEAPAWAVVTIDDDGVVVVDAVGPFDEPEQALIEAGRADAAWRTANPYEPPLRYEIVPFWEPTK